MKPRKPSFDVERFEERIEKILDDVADGLIEDFDSTVETFKDKPTFFLLDRSKGYIKVGTSLKMAADEIYSHLNYGTKVRYATMSADFKAKTKSGRIKSVGGQGGMVFVDKRHPRPGIKARKFDETIAKKWEKKIASMFSKKKFK